MKRYVIERDMPGIGTAERDAFRAAAEKSNSTLADLGPTIQWVESYVTDDKLYCVYLAEGENIVHKHAEISGFPADRVSEVKRVIDPTTAAA